MLARMLTLALRMPLLLGFAFVIASASPSFAMPVACESPSCVNWTMGEKANGHAGQLARISSREVREFVRTAALAADHVGVNKASSWTGGKKDSPQPPAACCMWLVRQDIRPETWSYENWMMRGEPSDDGKFEHRFLTTWAHHYKNGGGWHGGWHGSEHVHDHLKWFLIHWFQKCKPPVPEPGTAALAAIGMGLLALRRRRSR